MGFGGGGPQYQTTGVQTQQSAPWVRAQPHLTYAMNRARGLYGNNIGYRPWEGPTQAPINQQMRESFGMIRDQARHNPITRNAAEYARGILSGQQLNDRGPAGQFARDFMNNAGVSQGVNRAVGRIMRNGGTSGEVSDFARGMMGWQGPQQSTNYLQDLIGGSETRDGGTNPFMQQMLDTNAERAQTAMASTMAGSGRYGSFGHADALAGRIAELNNPLLAQTYESAMARQMQAANQLTANAQAQAGIQSGGAGLLAQNTQQGIANQIQAANLQANNQLAGQGLQMQGAGMLNGIDQAALQRQMQMAAMAPTMNSLQFSDANQLGTLGQYFQNRAQTGLNSRIAAHDQRQALPWEQLARFQGIVGGMGGLGGTRTATTQTPQAPFWQSTLGGAAMGAGAGSMFGPWGTGLGALGGGLMGAFA